MLRQSLARPGVFCRDSMFFGCDRVGNGGEFYVAIECCQG